MQAQHLVIAPGSLISIQLLAIDQIRRGRGIPRRPWSISRFRAVTAAWRATEHAAVELIRESGLDPADYPELNPGHSMAPHRVWLPAALELVQAEREKLLADPAADVLCVICFDAMIAAIHQAIEEAGVA